MDATISGGIREPLQSCFVKPGLVGSSIPRVELLSSVRGYDTGTLTRTVDVHIRRLRKSINATGERDIVRTVRAAGYALDTEPV